MADIRGNTNTNTLVSSSNDNWRGIALDRLGDLFTGDLQGLASRAAAAGRLVVASDADQNDSVLGQTSFANTTPTFEIDVPTGSCAVPLFVRLHQTGTVAGGAIDILIEADDIAARASGGTAETLFYFRNGAGFTSSVVVYSNPTATAGYGIGLDHNTVAADVSPAADSAYAGKFLWVPPGVLPLIGPASLKIFTYAATTGPTWFWSIGFLDLPPAMFTN